MLCLEKRVERSTFCLQLIFDFGSLLALNHALHQSHSCRLNSSNHILFVFTQGLIFLLKLLDFSLECRLRLSNRFLFLCHLFLQCLQSHVLVLLNLCLLLIIAQINVLNAAYWPQRLFGELLQILIRSSTIVVLKIRGITPLQSRKALNSHIITEWFSRRGTVDVSDKFCGRSLEFNHEFVPVGFDGLAVAAPRSEEFQKYSLAIGLRGKIFGCEFRGRRGCCRKGKEEC
mmetsp:Transcript_29879/g.63371  ORF Transcript_29879/g.63371 Transcript_29879/m.63371 type:complete len:230 (-) Transcript_29879:118-807(-)